MKRSEIIKTINTAGQMMDSFGGAIGRNVDTDECIKDLVTEEEIRAMQTTLHVCTLLLDKDLVSIDPLNLVGNLISLHGAMKLEAIAKGDDGEADEKPAEGDAE